jgi:hypothetical protein
MRDKSLGCNSEALFITLVGMCMRIICTRGAESSANYLQSILEVRNEINNVNENTRHCWWLMTQLDLEHKSFKLLYLDKQSSNLVYSTPNL